MEGFLKENSIIRKISKGKSSLEGNQSQEFLKKANKLELEEAFLNACAGVEGLPFVASLKSFNQVVEQYFGVELKEGSIESIWVFETKCRELNISITHKMHKVF